MAPAGVVLDSLGASHQAQLRSFALAATTLSIQDRTAIAAPAGVVLDSLGASHQAQLRSFALAAATLSIQDRTDDH